MQDYLEVLKTLKSEIEQDTDDINVDTIDFTQGLNPPLTRDSKSYKDSAKIIFKQSISTKNAEAIINLVTNTKNYDVSNLNDYKYEILNRCNLIDAQGENPIEMLVYATKGIYNNDIFNNAVRDLIKNIYEENQECVYAAYRNILMNWNWNDCLEFTLKSITDLKITKLQDEVYNIFESNNFNRALASIALISIDANNHYESLINFLCSQPNETRSEIQVARETLYAMAKHNDTNTIYIYKSYLKLNTGKLMNSIIVGAIRFNFNKTILDHIEKNLKNTQITPNVSRKMINLLGSVNNKTGKILEILNTALTYNHLDKRAILQAIGGAIPELQMGIILDKRSHPRERVNAIIALANSQDSDIENILDDVSNESDVLKAVVCSVKVQRGDNNKVIQLFEYILKRNDSDESHMEATNQIKRLRRLRKPELNATLMKVATSLLANDDVGNIQKVMKIIDLFTSGMPTEEIGELFLNKLNSTQHAIIKTKIINFYKKEFNRFTIDLRVNIKDAIVKCTHDDAVRKVAMECLTSINTFVDSTPTGGN